MRPCDREKRVLSLSSLPKKNEKANTGCSNNERGRTEGEGGGREGCQCRNERTSPKLSVTFVSQTNLPENSFFLLGLFFVDFLLIVFARSDPGNSVQGFSGFKFSPSFFPSRVYCFLFPPSPPPYPHRQKVEEIFLSPLPPPPPYRLIAPTHLPLLPHTHLLFPSEKKPTTPFSPLHLSQASASQLSREYTPPLLLYRRGGSREQKTSLFSDSDFPQRERKCCCGGVDFF